MAKVEIHKNAAVNPIDVIAKSPVSGVPDAVETLVGYLAQSHSKFVGYYEGQIACVMGLIPPTCLSTSAYIWLLHTDLVEAHKFLFIRHSRMWIADVLKLYSSIYGHVDPTHPERIRWLKWLGAEFGPADGRLVPFRISRHG